MRVIATIAGAVAFSLCGLQGSFAQSAPSWIQLSVTGAVPDARGSHSAIYDSVNERMSIFGGFTANYICGFGLPVANDAWVLTHATGLGGAPQWSALSPCTPPSNSAPLPRFAQAAAYDPGTNAMIMFAGLANPYDVTAVQNDAWIASNANGLGGASSWTKLYPYGGPPLPRYAPGTVYNPASNRMTVFGGGDAAGVLDDLWVLTNANGSGGPPTWYQLAVSGGPPPARTFHTAVYDPLANRMIVFGGTTGPLALNDVWVLSNADGLGGYPVWTQLNPSGGPPPPRAMHTATFDPTTNRMTIFGGGSDPVGSNDVWVLSNANGLGGPPTWTQLSPSGGPPQQRIRASAVYHPATNRMTLYSGFSGCCFIGDLWVLTNANGLTELEVAIEIKPPSQPPVPINLRSAGLIPVAILSTSTFDATGVDPQTILLSGASVKLKGKSGQFSCSKEDVNEDGRADLLCHVTTDQLQLQSGATTAILTGSTFAGTPIRGQQAIVVVPQ